MPSSRRIWLGPALLGLTLLPLASGCTAAIAHARISDAQAAILAAEAEGPSAKGSYEYVSAVLYLEKAKEAEAYSRFGEAMELSGTSTEYAEKAKAAARGLPVRSSTDQKPAK
jgi:hypothetical protein